MDYAFLSTLASTTSDDSILGSLGIDWMLLGVQVVAFLIAVAVLAKFVYPVFLKIIDERQEKIDASVKAAEAAQEKAEGAEEEVEKLLAVARKEAVEIVATAKSEASQMVEKAEKSAKAKSERIVAEAHEDIQKEIAGAKKTLEKDVMALVKQAASIATQGVADAKLDTAMIKKSIEGAKK